MDIVTMQDEMSIACMNNEAVHLLIAGEDERALRLLRESLVLMKGFVDPRPPFRDTDASIPPMTTKDSLFRLSSSSSAAALSFFTTTATPSDANHTSIRTSSSSSQQCCDGRCSSHLPSTLRLTGLEEGAESSQTFIYSKPFVFPDELSSKDLGCFLHIHCAVVIFNMALAHHHMAKSVIHSQYCAARSFLDKTIALYDMCLELLENCDPQLGNARLVELAALNNVSQLRFEAGDHVAARKGFDLLAVLMFGASFCPFVLSHFEEGDVRGFLLNIVLLQPSTVALAA
jgi:hypothetical protein